MGGVIRAGRNVATVTVPSPDTYAHNSPPGAGDNTYRTQYTLDDGSDRSEVRDAEPDGDEVYDHVYGTGTPSGSSDHSGDVRHHEYKTVNDNSGGPLGWETCYDPNGNLRSDNHFFYVYSVKNELVQVWKKYDPECGCCTPDPEDGDVLLQEYYYDVRGLRIATSNGEGFSGSGGPNDIDGQTYYYGPPGGAGGGNSLEEYEVTSGAEIL